MATIPPTTLVILDGLGASPSPAGNAVLAANTPTLDYLWNHFPHTLLKAAEEEVGLSFGEMGNSEVGHLILGSGQVIYQSLPRISLAIQDGSFDTNPAFQQAFDHVNKNDSALHLMGMVSVAGVHAHLDHFQNLIRLAAKNHIKRLYLHIIFDGRDSGPKDGPVFLTKVQQAISQYQLGTIASISGRAYPMDRNQNWERIQKAYLTLIGDQSAPRATDPSKALEQAYQQGLDDETLLPTVIVGQDNNPLGPLRSNDAFIFTNYREDRARQLIQFLTATPPAPAPTTALPQNFKIVTLTQYAPNLPVTVAFPPQKPLLTLSDHLEALGLSQLHISETEKYAHVTYFFNGGREKPLAHEKHIHIPSLKPELFISHPQMSAREVLNQTLTAIGTLATNVIIVNFANPDMIGHTGDLAATIKAVEVVDDCVRQIYEATVAKNGYLFVTADHGNAESKLDPSSHQPTKDHTTSPVPFIAVHSSLTLEQPTNTRVTLDSQVTGILADVAPTMLSLLNLPVPDEMTGTPLFVPKS